MIIWYKDKSLWIITKQWSSEPHFAALTSSVAPGKTLSLSGTQAFCLLNEDLEND